MKSNTDEIFTMIGKENNTCNLVETMNSTFWINYFQELEKKQKKQKENLEGKSHNFCRLNLVRMRNFVLLNPSSIFI